mmetsp:Transcript_21813/g.35962  ORF Transcript_21813/g.35962 Transcript_21813/m.35962 type:complete len:389 (+) Transcript_21813:211-1377(+)
MSANNMASSFPIGSKVILQNLAKAAQYNGMKGKVKSLPDPITSRQNVHVEAANKSLAVKPINLRHEPRELTSLSIEEMTSLLCHVDKMESHEMIELLQLEGKGEIGIATGVLQRLVRQRIGACPYDLAQLLAEDEAKKDQVNSKRREAMKNGPSSSKSAKEKLSPADYLKGRYKQNAKRDAKEEVKQCCNGCGKNNAKLLKCGRCLSVFYCSKECQKTDHVTHKKECKNLLKQRVAAVQNEVDKDTRSVDNNIPRFGVALSESITGVHGEVICHFPCWMIDEDAVKHMPPRDSLAMKGAAKNCEISIRYFFKVYQSSVEAAKSLSLREVGEMCEDALILYWMKYPGVRRVYAHEATSGEFTLQFIMHQDKPDGWSIVGFEDRLTKVME